jgi:hypothetical protein
MSAMMKSKKNRKNNKVGRAPRQQFEPLKELKVDHTVLPQVKQTGIPFERWVRIPIAFTSGVAFPLPVKTIAATDLSDYGIGVGSSRWYTLRIKQVRVWYVTLGSGNLPINVVATDPTNGTAPSQLTIAFEVLANTGTFVPGCAWKLGVVQSDYPLLFTSTNTIFTLPAANPTGLYLADVLTVFA